MFTKLGVLHQAQYELPEILSNLILRNRSTYLCASAARPGYWEIGAKLSASTGRWDAGSVLPIQCSIVSGRSDKIESLDGSPLAAAAVAVARPAIVRFGPREATTTFG